eukprot:gene2576-769_t
MDGKQNAFCTICHQSITPKASNLANHEKSDKHIKNINAANSTKSLPFANLPKKTKEPSEDVKRFEIELSVGISCHTAINSIDHLGQIMKRNGEGSIVGNIRLHRRKCTKILTNVVAPALKEELKESLINQKFSVVVDESTDVAANKHMAILLRYFDDASSEICTAFAGLVPVISTRGESLFEALKDCLAGLGLDLANCIGYGSDGASNMIGERNSLWSRILQEAPNCIQVKCICHSLSLCIQHAFEKLPSSLGFILKEVPKWFSKSTIRREGFKELFNTINPDNERAGIPLPFAKFCATRWLVRGKLLYNLLVNWEELKAYFIVAESQCDQNARFKARMIQEMLADPANYLYIQFVTPVVSEFEKVNSFFQATNADPEKIEQELDMHYRSLKLRVLDNVGNCLPIEQIDFGAKFLMEANTFVSKSSHTVKAKDVVMAVKERCLQFLKAALHEVESRLPSTKNAFRGISHLHPGKVLSQTDRLPFNNLPFPHLRAVKSDVLEEQYRKVLLINWVDENVFKGEIPDSTVAFWLGVLQYQNFLGSKPFKELAEYALSCLSLPVSNAIVERVFSYVTAIKTKQRNRMSSKVLDTIVRIRTHLHFTGRCCKDFKATDKMLELFNSKDMYDESNIDLKDLEEDEIVYPFV